jgi:hypothetical protein
MKKTTNILLSLLAAGLMLTSCEDKQDLKVAAPLDNHDHQSGTVWETTDPSVIKAIDDEISKNQAGGRVAAVQVYRGFRIETNAQTPADILALIKGEIDQMYISGLKSSTLTKMDDVSSIYIAPTGTRGLYYSNGRVVINDYATYRSVKRSTSGVVPHELTHYYHDRHLPSGFNNATVTSNYNNAVSTGIYPSSAYVMRNRFEYLATSAEAYFSGTSRDPFDRATVTRKDPRNASFISTNF